MEPLTILCVDDERHVLLTLKTQLQRQFPDCAIAVAESGDAALAYIEAVIAAGGAVPLVIVDQGMSEMKGHQVLIELHRCYPQMLKVMLVEQTSPEIGSAVIDQAGLYRCLSKPWNHVDLQLTVRHALQHYQQAQHLKQSDRELAALNQQVQQQRQELQHTQRQIKLFVEHTPAAIAMLDRNMRYLLVSQRWKTDYGLGEQEMIGRSHYEVFPEIPDCWKAIHQRCLSGATEQAGEDCFVRADGSVTWNQWEIRPWYTDTGEVGGIIMFTQVITERKLAQLALQESETRNRAILSAVPDIMTVISAEGYYLDVSLNQFSGEILPPKPGGHISEVLPPEAAHAYLAAIQQVLQTGTTQTYEQQIPFGDSIQYEEVRIAPYQADKVLCMVRDVTARKQAEFELHRQATQFTAITSNVPGGVFRLVCHPDGSYAGLFASGGHRMLCGMSPERLQAEPDLFLTMVHPDDRAEHLAAWNDSLQTSSAFRRESRYVLPTGEIKWVAIRAQFQRQPNNDVIIDGLAFDVTERKQIELEIIQSRDLREAIFHESADALFLVDPETLLTLDCNQRAVELFEADAKTALINIEGHTLQVQMFTDTELEDITKELAVEGFWSREIEYVTLRGRHFWGNIAAKRIQVAGQLLNLVRVTDISHRKRLEIELRRREAFLNSIYNGVEVAISVIDVESDQTFRYLDFNPTCKKLSGFDPDFLRGKTIEDLAPAMSSIDLETLRNQLQHCVTTGEVSQSETTLIVNHQPQWWLHQCAPLKDETGRIYRLVATSINITERKQAEAQLEAQNALLARIAKGEPLSEIFHAIIAQIEQQLPGIMGSVLLLDQNNRLQYGAAPSLPLDYVQATSGVQIGDGVGSCGTAAFLRRPVIAADIATDPCWTRYQEFALVHNLRACWSTPLMAADGRVLGTFGVYAAEPRSPQDSELEIIHQIANIAGIAIERDQAIAKVRRSEEQLQLTLDFTGIGAWSWHPTTGEYSWNGKVSELLELSTDLDNMFEAWSQRIHPNDVNHVQASIQIALESQTAFAEEYRYRLQDGRWVWRWFKGQGIYTETGEIERVLGIVQDITDRKRTEETLATIEAEQRSILESIPGFVAKVDRAGTMLFLNRTASGFTMAEVLGRNLDEFTAPESQFVQRQALAKVFATGETVTIETAGTGAYGDPTYYEVRIAPVYQNDQIEAAILVTTDITARKQAEQVLQQLNEELERRVQQRTQDLLVSQAQLQAKEQFLRGVFEGTGNPIFVVDVLEDGTFQFTGWNRACELISGVSTADAIGRSPQALFAGSVGNAMADHYRCCCAAGETIRYEEHLTFEEGDAWTLTTLTPLKNAEGRIYRIIGSAFDISDRKLVEAALAEKNAILQSVIESTPDVVYVKDAQGRYVIINSGFTDFFGQSADQLLGKTDIDLLPADTAAQIIQNDRQTIQSGAPYTVEEIVPRPDGSLRTYLTTKSPWYIPQSHLIGIIGLARDITEWKQAEQALSESEQRYATLASTAPVGIYRTNLQGECLYVNERWCKIAGLTAAAAQGMGWLNALHPQDRASVAQSWNRLVQTGERFRLEYRFQRPDGSMTWVFGQAVQERDDNGAVKGYVGTITDISDRKRLEQDLRQINAELEQRVADRTQDLQHAMESAQTANRAKTAFLANMSHELRTPLNAILGFSQLLNRDSNLTANQQEQVNIINRSGSHLLNLINDVLSMAKIEAGQTTLTVNRFELRELLRDLEELFRLKSEAKQLTLTVQIDSRVPHRIQTDEIKLRQVLINLVGNAIKFTQQGHVTVRVWPEADSDASTAGKDRAGKDRAGKDTVSLHFEVADTGFGIALDEQDRVFEPFGQTQTGRSSQEGSGLGLPISRQFVQLMGGELCLHSTLNQGSVFYFTIPVESVAAEDRLPDALAQSVVGLAADQPSYRLLVVEDNPDSRRFLMQLLSTVGFEVQTAVNGQEAVQRWQTWAPDLVWMDMRMPVMDGYRATQQIRQLEQQIVKGRPATKILALTASAFEDDRPAILAAGCDDILFKPVTEADLFEKITQHLGVRYRYQQPASQPTEPAELVDGFIAQELQRMPLEWVAQLQYAARIADEDLMLRVVDQLPSAETKLASALKELVTAFQIERLIELTAKADELL